MGSYETQVRRSASSQTQYSMKVTHEDSARKETLWDVHRAFQPLFRVSVALGLLSMTSTRIAGGGRSQLEKFSVVYSALFFLLSLAMLLGLPAVICNMKNNYTGQINNTTAVDNVDDFHYITIVYPMSVLLSGLCCRYVGLAKLRRDVPLILAKISQLDTVLRTPTNIHRNIFILSLSITVVSPIVITLLLGLTLISNNGIETFPHYTFGFHICIWSISTVETQFIVLCWMIKKRFQLLNGALKRLSSLYPSVPKTCNPLQAWGVSSWSSDLQMVEHVEMLRSCHLKLCRILRDINVSYQLHLLFSLTCGSFEILMCTYRAMFGFGYDPKVTKLSILSMVLGVFYHAVHFVVVAVTAGVTSNEAARTRAVAAPLNRRGVNASAKEEIAAFVTQIESQQMNFSVFDLFTLNSRLVSSVVSTIVTYLVILAQFRPSSGSVRGTPPTSPPGSPGHES